MCNVCRVWVSEWVSRCTMNVYVVCVCKNENNNWIIVSFNEMIGHWQEMVEGAGVSGPNVKKGSTDKENNKDFV